MIRKKTRRRKWLRKSEVGNECIRDGHVSYFFFFLFLIVFDVPCTLHPPRCKRRGRSRRSIAIGRRGREQRVRVEFDVDHGKKRRQLVRELLFEKETRFKTISRQLVIVLIFFCFDFFVFRCSFHDFNHLTVQN